MKHDVHKIFDRLCEEIYFGMNFKLVLLDMEKDKLEELCAFINKCRVGRKAAILDYHEFIKTPILTLSWNEWNSGGGCMIWSHDFVDGTSVHVTDEVLVLSKYNSAKHWEAEFSQDEDEVDYILLTYHFTEEHESPLSFSLCPFVGQELADLVAKDIYEILRCF